MADNTDDGVLENWEDEDAEVLERRMEERQRDRQRQQEKEKKKLKAAHVQKIQGETPVTPLEVQTHLPLRTHDVGRTEYVAPIKILKRQVDAKGSPTSSHTNTSSAVQRKSLAEREADYASARARILGSGYRASDETSSSPTVTAKSVSSRGSGETVESVKRQPKGPNGTKGFKARAKS